MQIAKRLYKISPQKSVPGELMTRMHKAKLLKENIRDYLHDFGTGNNVLNKTHET